MTNRLSDWARDFLNEDRVAIVGTLNKDGSAHLAAVWYWLADDGTVAVTTPVRSQKSKNVHRDPRITLCVGDMGHSVSLSGRVSIIEDQALVRQDLERVIGRYVKDEGMRPHIVTNLLQRTPVALHLLPEKVIEFSGWDITHS